MMTNTEKEFIQIYQDASEEGKLFIFDMILCAATCGEGFFKELQATPQEPAAIKAVVTKWKATIPAAG